MHTFKLGEDDTDFAAETHSSSALQVTTSVSGTINGIAASRQADPTGQGREVNRQQSQQEGTEGTEVRGQGSVGSWGEEKSDNRLTTKREVHEEVREG